MPSPDDRRSRGAPGRRALWRVGVPVTACLAGFLFATSGTASHGHDFRVERNLPDEIRAESRVVTKRTKQVAALRSQIASLTAAKGSGNARLATLTRSAGQRGMQAGLTPMTGPALRVTLDDAHRSLDSLPEGLSGDDIVVHQQDVQAVVNAMWAGGAEGIMIQDQRIVSTSAVRCVGNTLLLQGRVYSPPYAITAVGDVDRMERTIQQDKTIGIYREYVDAVGLGYEVTRPGTVTLPGFVGAVEPTHARAVR